MKKLIGLVAMTGVLCGLGAVIGASPSATWVDHDFTTIDAMVKYLNTRPDAMECKMFAEPSSRNVLGWAGNPYHLICRDFK